MSRPDATIDCAFCSPSVGSHRAVFSHAMAVLVLGDRCAERNLPLVFLRSPLMPVQAKQAGDDAKSETASLLSGSASAIDTDGESAASSSTASTRSSTASSGVSTTSSDDEEETPVSQRKKILMWGAGGLLLAMAVALAIWAGLDAMNDTSSSESASAVVTAVPVYSSDSVTTAGTSVAAGDVQSSATGTTQRESSDGALPHAQGGSSTSSSSHQAGEQQTGGQQTGDQQSETATKTSEKEEGEKTSDKQATTAVTTSTATTRSTKRGLVSRPSRSLASGTDN